MEGFLKNKCIKFQLTRHSNLKVFGLLNANKIFIIHLGNLQILMNFIINLFILLLFNSFINLLKYWLLID